MAMGLPLLVDRLIGKQRLKLLSQHVVHDLTKKSVDTMKREIRKPEPRKGFKTLPEGTLVASAGGTKPFRQPVGLLCEGSRANSAQLALGTMSSFVCEVLDGVNGLMRVELVDVGFVLPVEGPEVTEELLLLDEP